MRSRRDWLAPAAVLALSLFTRLVRIDLAQFDIDQVKLIQPAIDFLRTGQPPLYGGTTFSVGISIPPLITYLLALPLLASRDPVWLTAVQAALDGLGALAVYAAVRQLGSPFGGLAAGAFYAVLPDAILNSRAITNGGLAPCLCAVSLWGLVGFVKTGNARRLALSALALGLAVELHVTVAVFAPVLIAGAVLRRRDVRWQPLAGAAAALLATLAPYLVFQAARGFADVRSLGGLTGGGGSRVDAAGLEVVAAVAAGSIQDHFTLRPLDAVGWVVLAVVAVGLVVAVWRYRPAGVLLAGWVALPLLATARHGESLAPHYYFGLFPAVAMLGGLGFAAIPWRPVGIVALAAFIPLRVGQWLAFQNDLAAGRLPADLSVTSRYGVRGEAPARYAAPYNTPLRYEVEAAAALTGPAYVGPREGYDQVLRYLTNGRVPVVSLSGRGATLLPPDGSLLLLDGSGGGLEWPLANYATPVGRVNATTGGPFFTLLRLGPGWLARFNSAVGMQPLEAGFAGGPRLTGFAFDGGRLRLEWQLQRPRDDLRLFARLADGNGTARSSDPDRNPFAGIETGGDVLTETAVTPAADIATGGYFLDLGLYHASAGARLPLASGGTEVRLGPFRVQGAAAPAAGTPLAVFGGQIALEGVQRSGDSVTLTWAALGKPRAAYTVFVHALDAAGRVVAQQDGPPDGGSFPTTLWAPGDVARDTHRLAAGSLAEATTLEIGLYSQPGLERLPVSGGGSAFELPLPASAGAG